MEAPSKVDSAFTTKDTDLQRKALKNFAQGYEVNVIPKGDSLHKLSKSKPAVEKFLRDLLKGF